VAAHGRQATFSGVVNGLASPVVPLAVLVSIDAEDGQLAGGLQPGAVA
jgi:hypothetical protein